MELVTENAVRRYLEHDTVGRLMDECTKEADECLVCQRWLRDSVPKRLIFERLYGDLLRDMTGRRVLDVGGGFTCFTRLLARRNRYELIDLLAHSGGSAIPREGAGGANPHLHVVDWYSFMPDNRGYDVVIANDLFPNVDQRLSLFLEKFVPIAREVRLSLTFYSQPRFYLTRRIQGDEMLCMLAWDGEATRRVLEEYVERIVAPNLTLLTAENPSVYPNGRQVCLVRLDGDQT